MRTSNLFLFFMFVLILSGYAQPINSEFIPNGKAPKLLGKINKQGLSEGSYGEWFLKNYDAYTPDATVIASFEEELKQYTITAFMGTWCGDSKRDVPRFYKILETADFPLERLTIIAVDRSAENYKQSPGGEQEGLGIHRVPTFIFYKNGQEVNRIVESPVESLELDIAHIIEFNYTPNYAAALIVHNLLASGPLSTFAKRAKKKMPKLKETIRSLSELNTYSNVLFAAAQQEEAIAVAYLNTMLFPEESKAYLSLADKLFTTSNFSEAQKNYEKALALDPSNRQLQESIASLKISASN